MNIEFLKKILEQLLREVENGACDVGKGINFAIYLLEYSGETTVVAEILKSHAGSQALVDGLIKYAKLDKELLPSWAGHFMF